MEFINELLWNINFSGDYQNLAIKFLVFIFMWILFLYLFLFVITKIFNSNIRKDAQIKLNFLYALAGFQFLILIYLFFLFRYNGITIMKWNDSNFYLGFGPQLLLFLGTIILFVLRYQDYKRTLKF